MRGPAVASRVRGSEGQFAPAEEGARGVGARAERGAADDRPLIEQVLDAAAANGRKVALLGRSMVRNMGIASDLGYLKVPDGVLIDYKKAVDLPDDRIVFMSTGSQGEPMAVLARMANLEHQIEIGPGDTVVLWQRRWPLPIGRVGKARV